MYPDDLYANHEAIMNFVYNHNDIVTHAHSVSAKMHDGRYATSIIPDAELEHSMGIVTFRDTPGYNPHDALDRVAIVITYQEDIAHVLYIHPDIKDAFETEVVHL